MSEFMKKLTLKARLPPAQELKTAFCQFFEAKERRHEPVFGYQAHYALQLLVHLQKTPQADGKHWLSLRDLRTAHGSLLEFPDEEDGLEQHKALARELYQVIQKRKAVDYGSKAFTEGGDLWTHTRVMGNLREGLEARKLLLEGLNCYTGKLDMEMMERAWRAVIFAFRREGNDEELLRTLSMMQEYSSPFTEAIHHDVTTYFADKGDFERTKEWYNRPIADGRQPHQRTLLKVIKVCLKHNDLEWGRSIIHAIMQGELKRLDWDLIFLWAAGTGKGVEELDRMMNVMVQRNPGRDEMRPDIATINKLVAFAMERNDPYSAERYISLGQKWNIKPNTSTYTYQMLYRLSVGDIDGARAAYTGLRGEEVAEKQVESQSVYAINRLVQAMCAANRYGYEAIIAVVEDLNERKARFEPGTVAALTLLHLRRDELHDVIDLLQTHAFHFNTEQRKHVLDVLVSYCLDRSNSVARVWDAYIILYQIFGEADRVIRTRLIEEFFARRRSDMAVHVFNHMRQDTVPANRPTADTYIAAFMGVASTGDIESLELIHNQLKLDFDIEPGTRLYNALMLAYTNCDEPRRALEFWDDICNSREGPSYESIRIAFWACEKAPFGERQAVPIWERLRKMDIEISRDLLGSYVGALAGNSLFEEASEILLKAEEELGIKPDTFM